MMLWDVELEVSDTITEQRLYDPQQANIVPRDLQTGAVAVSQHRRHVARVAIRRKADGHPLLEDGLAFLVPLWAGVNLVHGVGRALLVDRVKVLKQQMPRIHQRAIQLRPRRQFRIAEHGLVGRVVHVPKPPVAVDADNGDGAEVIAAAVADVNHGTGGVPVLRNHGVQRGVPMVRRDEVVTDHNEVVHAPSRQDATGRVCGFDVILFAAVA